MSRLKELSFADYEQEMATTRRVLERVPDDHQGWKPHERSMSLGELATHIVDLVGMQLATLTRNELDFASPTFSRTVAHNQTERLEAFDGLTAKVREAIDGVDEEALATDWTFRVGEHVVFTRPKLVAFRSFGVSHLAHHRGQLTVYLRMLDIPLPPVYGPTADER